MRLYLKVPAWYDMISILRNPETKESGNPDCDPDMTWADSIDENYFPFVNDPDLTNITTGCIVVWGEERVDPDGHAAYVIYVPSPLEDIGDILVDHIPHQGYSPQDSVEIRDILGQGDPVGYHTGGGVPNTVGITFKNSFGDGWIRAGTNKGA